MYRPQFSLKTLFWLMLVVASFFAGLAIGMRRERGRIAAELAARREAELAVMQADFLSQMNQLNQLRRELNEHQMTSADLANLEKNLAKQKQDLARRKKDVADLNKRVSDLRRAVTGYEEHNLLSLEQILPRFITGFRDAAHHLGDDLDTLRITPIKHGGKRGRIDDTYDTVDDPRRLRPYSEESRDGLLNAWSNS